MFSLTINVETGENTLSDNTKMSCQITDKQKDDLDIYFIYEDGIHSCFNVDSLSPKILAYFNKHATADVRY